jgi:hypothetical protein
MNVKYDTEILSELEQNVNIMLDLTSIMRSYTGMVDSEKAGQNILSVFIMFEKLLIPVAEYIEWSNCNAELTAGKA